MGVMKSLKNRIEAPVAPFVGLRHSSYNVCYEPTTLRAHKALREPVTSSRLQCAYSSNTNRLVLLCVNGMSAFHVGNIQHVSKDRIPPNHAQYEPMNQRHILYT